MIFNIHREFPYMLRNITVVNALNVLTNLNLTTIGGFYHCNHFPDEEIEALKSLSNLPKPEQLENGGASIQT